MKIYKDRVTPRIFLTSISTFDMSKYSEQPRNADFSLKGRIQEATTYLFDLGNSMSYRDDQIPGSTKTPIELGLSYFKDRFGEKLVSNLKLIFTSIVVARDGGEVALYSDPRHSYANTEQLIPLCNVKLSDISEANLMEQLVPSSSYKRCVIDSLDYAVRSLNVDCGTKKVVKTIVVITDGGGEPKNMSDETLALLKQADIHLRILLCGKTKDSAADGTSLTPERAQFLHDKATNVKEYQRICDLLTDEMYQASIFEADTIVESLTKPLPSAKATRKLFGGIELTIGDSTAYGPKRTLSTTVNIYPCTRKLTRTTAKDVYLENGKPTGVIRSRQYYIPKPKSEASDENSDEADASEEGDVDFDRDFEPVDSATLIDGYLYGREIITVDSGSAIAEAVRPGFEIIGTVKLDSGLEKSQDDTYFYLPHWLQVSHVNYVVADPLANNFEATSEFIARIHALQADGMAYVARFAQSKVSRNVETANKMDPPPQMVLLCPYIAGDDTLPALLMIELPFAEDIRLSEFPSFDLQALFKERKKIALPGERGTESAEKLEQEALAIAQANSDRALDLMRSVVSKMNLMDADVDDDNHPTEAINILDIVDPYDHRIKQALKHRAFTTAGEPGSETIPPKLTVQTQYQHPSGIVVKANDDLEQLFELLDIREVTKQLSEAEKRKAENGMHEDNARAKKTNLDIGSLLD